MFKVVITDYIGPEVEPEKALIGDLAEIVCLRARSVAELEGRVEDADAIIIFHEVTLPGELIDRLENCRVIARGGVGYDAVDFRRAGERGIPVCNVPDYGVDEVADQAIGMMIASNRGCWRSSCRSPDPRPHPLHSPARCRPGCRARQPGENPLHRTRLRRGQSPGNSRDDRSIRPAV